VIAVLRKYVNVLKDRQLGEIEARIELTLQVLRQLTEYMQSDQGQPIPRRQVSKAHHSILLDFALTVFDRFAS
jgi:hypothetical protein